MVREDEKDKHERAKMREQQRKRQTLLDQVPGSWVGVAESSWLGRLGFGLMGRGGVFGLGV